MTGRVLVYGMNYAPEMAGVGRYTGEIAEHLAAGGKDVIVVTTPAHYPGWVVQAPYRNGYQTEQLNGVTVVRCPLLLRKQMEGVWRLIAPISFAATSLPAVLWQFIRHRPDTVLCIEPTLIAAPIAVLAAKLTGAKTILHVQDLEVDAAFAVGHIGSKPWLRRLGYSFERWVMRAFDRVVTISNRMAEKITEKGVAEANISVIRNWVDLDQIFPVEGRSPYRDELDYDDDTFIVLYSGNLGAKQGLHILLDAADALKDNRSIRFIIAGEGPAKDDLIARYDHLETVRFLPFQPYSRLNAFLNMADLHALPQDANAADLVLPSKLGGMLASGRPIVVTAASDTEIFEFLGQAAFITPPGDSSRLAEAILDVAARKMTTDRVLQRTLSSQLSRTDGLKRFADAMEF
ncbi:WcaI family glycosyltransferase [Mesorhizobium sp. BR1-1-16]|uniref:WcaI family glycosyltransferase n=1 Tax=Mesorhizobium sp. BR1-1-16 TaxID=2876653 RepID=UPI001CCA9C8E|nr:WcaI family glycosyltransferase [Mesorhizobium sp. BR1-1-16]MBZ9937946.1 WcaI family glycosyltransferase [Mesorhizobium sp. BR1-1-16]